LNEIHGLIDYEIGETSIPNGHALYTILKVQFNQTNRYLLSQFNRSYYEFQSVRSMCSCYSTSNTRSGFNTL